MARLSTLGVVLAGSIVTAVGSTSGCGSAQRGGFGPFDGGASCGSHHGRRSGDDGTVAARRGFGDDSGGMFGGGDGAVSSSGTTGDGGEVVCPAGLMCDVPCAPGQSTTITGTVYDPSGKDPLYNIAVYVPQSKLQPLPRGIPAGADACSCAALFKSGAVVSTTTDVKGQFTLTNAPVGTNVPLVLQVGKWRHVVTIPTVTACTNNAQPDGSLALNSTVAPGSDDNIPDIAVSTGHSDTLECLMKRIGLPDSEYVAGPAMNGHVHIFSGGNPALPVGTTGGTEVSPMPGAPESDTNLWDTSDHLMPYDILLLSCEGNGTYNPNPPALETYLNAGGRAFASHFHYAWFTQPTTPPDWGTCTAIPGGAQCNLATWTYGAGGSNINPGSGVIDQTLNVGGGTFANGVALDQWLTNLGALGVSGAAPGDLPIFQTKFNAVVTATNTPSQPWITMTGNVPKGGGTPPTQTMYFSFDTPVNGQANDGGAPTYCGRAVFSDLHLGSNANSTPDIPSLDSSNDVQPNPPGCGTNANPCTSFTPTGQPPPQGCAANSTDGGPGIDLSPQEKALEFMLFDLSSCVLSDKITPPKTIPVY